MALNALKIKHGQLCPTDVYITLMMLCVHNIALAATLSSKEALASRWYVWLVTVVHCLAWAAGFNVIVRFPNQNFYCQDRFCCLVTAFPPLTSCPTESYDRLGGPLVYWISRLYNFIQSAVIALMRTAKFDSIEKIDREHQRANDITRTRTITAYGDLPSTAFSTWRGFALYPVVLIVAVETHISKHELTLPGCREWGQTTALVTCACGVGHWIWVNLHNLRLYLKSLEDGTNVEHRRMLPVNVSLLVLMGAKPPIVSEEDIRLLRYGTSEAQWRGRSWLQV